MAASAIGVAGMAALLLFSGAVWDTVGMTAALAGSACMASGTFLTRRWKPAIGRRYFGHGNAHRWGHRGPANPHQPSSLTARPSHALGLLLGGHDHGAGGPGHGSVQRRDEQLDAEGAARVFALAANELPVILATVGHSAPANWPQEPRNPVHEVMASA